MLPVKEIFVTNDQLFQVIYSGNIEEIYPMIQRNRKLGLQTLEQDLLMNMKAGVLSTEVAMEAANRPKLLKDMMQYTSTE